MSFKCPSLFATALTLAIAAALLGAGSAGAQATECDLVLSPGGDGDVDELLDSLAPGQTGCLRAGTYVDDQYVVKTPGVRLTSYPGERATLQGRLRFNPGADGAVVENLELDGRNPEDWLGPLIYADRVVLRGNEISNDHTAICVHVDAYPGEPPPEGVVVEGNRIHDCGRLPATNQHHGIYLAEARGTVIRDNWIYDNADRGIQLYPDADGSVVTGNVIDGNGQGVIFSGDDDDVSENNLVEGNVITNSTIRYNIESHWQGPTGSGNMARDNCVWGGARDDGDGGIESPQDGFTAVGNLVVDPLYVNGAAADYELAPASLCGDPSAGARPRDGRGAVELSARRHSVRYRHRFTLAGGIEGAAAATGGDRALILIRRHGRWQRFATARVNLRGRFVARPRARYRSPSLRVRAEVEGVGRSKAVRLRVRDTG